MSESKPESVVVRDLFADIASLKDTHPDYFAYFDDVDPDTATREELLDLMTSAPNERVKYFLFGKYSMRLTIASVTGREFK